jgi:hypothetical protein
MSYEWFRRLADVPGLNYSGNSAINQKELTKYKLKPITNTYEIDGKLRTSAMWDYGDITTSESPASRWKTLAKPGETSGQTILREVYEKLELPGQLADYHFSLQNCIRTLWSQRLQEPELLPIIEQLCWLDIKLIQYAPSTVYHETTDGAGHYFAVHAFSTLIDLYRSEGYLYEVQDILSLGFQLHQGNLGSIQDQLARLEEEHA